MYAAATFVCVAVFSSFSWGVLRFFVKPAGQPRSLVTAALGLSFGVWHAFAIATAATAAWRVALGMAAQMASAALFWSAVRACRSRPLTAIFTPDLPVHVLTVGPYAYVRHPFYVAYTLFWVAGWVMSDSVVALLSVPVMVWIYVEGAREEERKFSRSSLAREYADYRRRVGAWLPRPIRGAGY